MARIILLYIIGAFVTGFSIKFMYVYWLEIPNFIDGIMVMSAGIILLCIATSKIFKYYKIQKRV